VRPSRSDDATATFFRAPGFDLAARRTLAPSTRVRLDRLFPMHMSLDDVAKLARVLRRLG